MPNLMNDAMPQRSLLGAVNGAEMKRDVPMMQSYGPNQKMGFEMNNPSNMNFQNYNNVNNGYIPNQDFYGQMNQNPNQPGMMRPNYLPMGYNNGNVDGQQKSTPSFANPQQMFNASAHPNPMYPNQTQQGPIQMNQNARFPGVQPNQQNISMMNHQNPFTPSGQNAMAQQWGPSGSVQQVTLFFIVPLFDQ